MLIKFSAANFLSLKERQTLSLVKARQKASVEGNTFAAPSGLELLRSAAVYGANGGGKSNLLRALSAMKRIVTDSAAKFQRGDHLPVTPFKLSADHAAAPCELEAHFIAGGTRYQYGFAATREKIHEEWLIAYPKGRPQKWFTRQWREDEQRYDWRLGAHLGKSKELWRDSTRDNGLFLSTAALLNSDSMKSVYDWFSVTLKTAGISGWSPGFTASLCLNGRKDEIIEFLNQADLGIDDITVEKKSAGIALPEDMPGHLKAHLKEAIAAGDVEQLIIETARSTGDGRRVLFDLGDESEGTQRLFNFAGPWLDSLEKGHVLFIDELNNSMHPHLARFLLQRFNDSRTNPRNAQIIFTTHDTSMLDQELMRRDQIWFIEKDQDHASALYPLTDFSPRKGRENLEAAYRSGRYGAVPYLRQI